MNIDETVLHLVEVPDVLAVLREWVRRERQRANMTQQELAMRSNVPATTISRLERTGLASTDALLNVLFALNLIDPLQDFLKEHLRLASFPKSLAEEYVQKPVRRVRHRKGEKA